MSSRSRGVGSGTAPSKRRSLSSDSSPVASTLICRIKQNFDLETQSCSQRDHSIAQDTSIDRDDVSHVQDQLRRLKRRCAKLERKVQEKDAEIQALQDQQQLRFPLLMHETVCSLRSLEDNQSDRTTSASPLSQSVISSTAHARRDLDPRVHEYEQQIAVLYEENQQEKLKNEMLSECLRGQKHAKVKLIKACKHVKQELQALKDSGLSQMLVDIEMRCGALEKEKAQIMEELVAERSFRAKQEAQQKATAKKLEDLILKSTKWEDIVARKNEKLQQSRDQICEQQLTIEHLKADLKVVEYRVNSSPEICREDDQDEIEKLKAAISVQRTKVEVAQRELQQIKTENDFLREQLVSQHGEIHFQDDNLCAAHGTYDKLLIQVLYIKRRLRALKELVQMYEETNTVDINLLNEGESFQEDCSQHLGTHSCEGYAVQLSGSVLEAAQYVSELQEILEDACSRLIGSTCAMQ